MAPLKPSTVGTCAVIVILLGIFVPGVRAAAGGRPWPATTPKAQHVVRIVPRHVRSASSISQQAIPRSPEPRAGSSREWGLATHAFCWSPGEPVIAVGPTDIVETVNTAATVYKKSDEDLLAEFDFGTFWGSGTTSASIRGPSICSRWNASPSAAPTSQPVRARCASPYRRRVTRPAVGTSMRHPTHRFSIKTRSSPPATSSSSQVTAAAQRRSTSTTSRTS